MNITKNIFYVGVNDRQKALFEGLWPLPNGVSYNSYLIVDEKVCLIDTVEVTFFSQFLENVRTVIGERPIDQTEHFSWKKKKFQHLGSWVVRVASNTDIPDAPSGFRAYSREAALRINVVNEYTYTLETIIQAGHNKVAMTSVPIRTNEETRPSRLFSSMWRYMKRSATVITRSFVMYQPLKFFSTLGIVLMLVGTVLGVRFLIYMGMGDGDGHIQSLILTAILLLGGFQTITIGLLGDTIAANRKIMEDMQYRIRKMECAQHDDEAQ